MTPIYGVQGVTTPGPYHVAMLEEFADADDTVEILVTKPGTGSLSLDGKLLDVKSAKPLPSSD